MESNQFHTMPKQKHIGSRTHKDVKEGKIIRIDEDGLENFSDYWTDLDSPQSSASVHIEPSVHPDNGKTQAESHLAQENESSATLSPFTPSQDECTSLQINSQSGICEASSGQPSHANSKLVLNREEKNMNEKTITGNIHQSESNDVAPTLELPKKVTEHKSKIPVQMKRVRAATVESDGGEPEGMKGAKSSDVATTTSHEVREGISQDPLCTELTKVKRHVGFEKCFDQSTVALKAIKNPVVVLHGLSPRCCTLLGTMTSYPLNTKGDVAGTISRPKVSSSFSAGIHQTSPEIVKPTRKKLTYSPESPVSHNIFQGTQMSDVACREVNEIASSSLSTTDKRNATDVLRLQPLESLMVAEAGTTKPEASNSSKGKYEEFPVVSRQRKSHCHAEIKPKDNNPSTHNPSSVANVVPSVGRSLHLVSAQKSKAFSNEAQTTVSKDSEQQIPAENSIEIDNLQDTEIFSEADSESNRDVECFDLFDKASSLLGPLLIEDDNLVADGREEDILISLPSKTSEEKVLDDTGDRNSNNDDFQMAPLGQVKTVRLSSHSAPGINVDAKKLKKTAKTKAKSDLVLVGNRNSPDSMDVIESVGEQNDVVPGSQAILERPDSTKILTAHESSSKVARNKTIKARKEACITNVRKNKTSSDTKRKPDEAASMDMGQNLCKNEQKARRGYKKMKEIQLPPDILRKRRKRTQNRYCNVSEQEEEDFSTEEMQFRSTVPSQSVSRVGRIEARKEKGVSDVTTERRKSVISSECERSLDEETEEEEEEAGRRAGDKTITVKMSAVTIQKNRKTKGKGLRACSKKSKMKSLADSFKKNTRTKGKSRLIIQPQIDQERREKQSRGKHNEDSTVLNPLPINKCVADTDYLEKKKKTVLREDQATRDSEHLVVACGQMGMETTGEAVVNDRRQSSMPHNVSNNEPVKTRVGSSLIQNALTLENRKRPMRHAAAVAEWRNNLVVNQAKRKINSVSRRSLVSKQTENETVSPSLKDTPDVENKEMLRISQRNTTETPETRPSVASQLHYFDSTVSHKTSAKQKMRKIFPPAGNDPRGVRRSRRTRVRPLDWFRNERIHYERRESGFVVAGIYSPKLEPKHGAAEKVVKKKFCKEGLPEKKRRTERNMSIHADISHSLLPSTRSEIKVVNPLTQEEVFMECVKTLDQAKMVGVSGKPPTDDEPLLLCKPIRQKTFASGTVIIRPMQVKKMQFVQNDTMLFHVIHGKVEVTIHQTNFIVESRDKFFVPVGNSYSIRNLRNEDAELDFTQIKT